MESRETQPIAPTATQGAIPDIDDPIRVLVVEDESEHQFLIRRALGRDPEQFPVVQVARHADEAIRFTRQMRFDILLVDNRIPGMRGLDLLTPLREAAIDAPFVLMTSAGSEGLAVAAWRQNADAYLIKDSGFWRDLPQVLTGIVKTDRRHRHDQALIRLLQETNTQLEDLHATLEADLLTLQEAAQEAHSALASGDTAQASALLDTIVKSL